MQAIRPSFSSSGKRAWTWTWIGVTVTRRARGACPRTIVTFTNIQNQPQQGRAGVTAEAVSGLCQQGNLPEAVEALGLLVCTHSHLFRSLFYTVLKECVATKDLLLGRRVHALAVKRGYEADTFLCNHILRMYASHARLQEAMDVFTRLAQPDAFTWSAIISSHVKQGQDKRALQLYHQMRTSNVKPDGHVFVAALQACARSADLESGQQVHAHVLATDMEPNLFVWNCLLDMYAKCGRLDDARRVFDSLREKDVVTWTAMIAGYSQQGMGQEALHLYRAMQEEGIVAPNSITLASLLQACAIVGAPALAQGKQLHAHIRERALQADVFVANGLVNMYAKCGSLEEAQQVFDGLGHKNVVTWSAMIAGYSQRGMGLGALRLYSSMQRDSMVVPDSVTFLCLLQACASLGSSQALEMGKQLHAQMGGQGLVSDVFAASSLVNMYTKCGSLEDARSVFDGLASKNVVIWNAMIAGYSQRGLLLEALDLYTAMYEEGKAAPDAVTFVSLLQACASVGTPALERGKELHAQTREQALQADVFVSNSLVNMYAKCGSVEDALAVFNGIPQKDVVTWNAMLAGYSQQGMGEEALRLFSAMEEGGVAAPNSVTFVCLLQACASVSTPALEKGRQLHAQIREQGLQADVFIANSLVNMYAKCGSLEDAKGVFDRLLKKDVVTWNAMIAGYSQQGMGMEALRLFCGMQEEEEEGGLAAPDYVTFLSLLQACANVGTPALELGKQLHARVREGEIQADVVVGGSLVQMYAKCGTLEDARGVFEGLVQKDAVAWNAMIRGYAQQGMEWEALGLGRRMLEDMVAPDSVTFMSLLQACASVGEPALEQGKQLHAQVREQGYEGDPIVASSLVNMYAKCGSLEDSQKVFDGLGEKDVVMWTSLMAAYSHQGIGHEALRLFRAMQGEGIVAPDSVTYVCLLQACASLGTQALETGRQLHAQIRDQGMESDEFVANSLVSMYAKCGSLRDARAVFDALGGKSVVTWNSMIAGYSQQDRLLEALSLYRAMREGGVVEPDCVTYMCLLQTCGNVAALHLGRQLHAVIEEQGLLAGVAGSLINMYGKCGSMVDAQQVFEELTERDVGTWSALIAGYARRGDSDKVFDLVLKMEEAGTWPDGITFLSVLAACSHRGLVNKGRHYFDAMSRHHGITPTADHYTCMVDLLGRVGQVEEALAFVRAMPVLAGPAVWHTLLGACRKWGKVEVGRHAFDEAVRLDQRDAAAYVLMWNIFTDAHMWEQAQEIQARRKGIRAWKQPGQSCWTDMDGLVHSFLVGDAERKQMTFCKSEYLINDERTTNL